MRFVAKTHGMSSKSRSSRKGHSMAQERVFLSRAITNCAKIEEVGSLLTKTVFGATVGDFGQFLEFPDHCKH